MRDANVMMIVYAVNHRDSFDSTLLYYEQVSGGHTNTRPSGCAQASPASVYNAYALLCVCVPATPLR